MAILKTVVWSAACVGLGLFLGTVERRHGPKLDSVKSELKRDFEGAVASAKVKLAPKSGQPVEAHTDTERDAVNALVARRSVKH